MSDVTVLEIQVHHPTTGVRQGVVETRVLAAVRVKHTQTEPLSFSGSDSSGLYHTEGVLREVSPVVPLWPDPDDFLNKTSQDGGLEITQTRENGRPSLSLNSY